MADAMQGIMGLPQAPTSRDSAPSETIDPSLFSPVIESYARNNPVEFGNDMLNSMEAADPALVQKFKSYLSRVKLPLEVIDAMGQLVDLVLGNPERYDEIRAELLKEGVPEELLPEEFDMAFFAALNIALDQLPQSQSPAPVQMARGGIATLSPIASEIAKMGRGEDKMLAHITPGEARMLRRRGGRGSINPVTGLPEYGFFSSIGKAIGSVFKGVGDAVTGIVKGVGKVIKEVASSTIGKIILTAAAVYFLGPAGLNLAGTAGSITGLTGSLAVGVNTFAASTVVGLASGQNLGQALKSGAIAGVTAGFGSAVFGLPPGYEASGTQAPAPIIDKSFPASSPAPVTDAAGLQEGAQTSAVPKPEPLIRTELPQSPEAALREATSVARAPVTQVTAPSEVLPSATSTAAPSSVGGYQPSVSAPAVTPSATVPSPTDLGSGLRLDMPSGPPGLRVPELPTPTVGQVGIETLTPRTLAQQAVQPAAQMAQPPGFLESLKEGNFTDAAKAAYRNISPSEIQKTGVEAAQNAGIDAMNALKARIPNATPSMLDSAYQAAYKAAMPGLVATYGPLALTGVAAMGALGGFKKEQPEPPPGFSGPTGIDLLKSDPKTYGLAYGGTRTSYALNPYDYMYSQLPPMRAATGGIASLDRYAKGGQPSHFPRKTGPINGPGTGTSDSIPAMLSDGEFVFTAKAVRGAGNGSRRAGAKRMYALMKAMERKA
jgi:hypothetical protein